MISVPEPFKTWFDFNRTLRSSFEYDDTKGPTYDGVRYTWAYITQMVVEEAGQHAPPSAGNKKTFDFSEGKLEIERGVTLGGGVLKITGFFEPGKYKTGECWILEELGSEEAANKWFQSFDKHHAEYMMRRLLFSYSETPDNY
jgi:hypothetical protein